MLRRALMVWGCTSGAGKSLIAAALCRWASNAGLDVAPFKAQNMSNNARVVPGPGGDFAEIGSAQYHQALAARVAPSVDHNPVLLKPEADTRSQVVLRGRVARELGTMPWRERSSVLAATAREAFERLAGAHTHLVIEGAGSPAETNLAAHDYVNLGSARWACARARGGLAALLVADIDRGGAFAHALGTWQLLPEDLRPRLAGVVLNKFRGDAALLAPAPQQLQAATGVPVLGVLPMWREHGLPDEDGLPDAAWAAPASGAARQVVAVLAPPHLSNLDEFEALAAWPGVLRRWVRQAAQLDGADWLVLPGSKHTLADLAWLRRSGLDDAVRAFAAAGRPVLGLCGGLQMLGERLHDPQGLDGGTATDDSAGLGLLPLHTRFSGSKRLQPGQVRFDARLGGPWQALAGLQAQGYEIRCGDSLADDDAGAAGHAAGHAAAHAADGRAIGWCRGPVLGVYAHGLLESPAVLHALFGLPRGATPPPTLDQRLDALAAWLERHLGAPALLRLFNPEEPER